MNETWWVKAEQLDDEQRRAVNLNRNASHLISGPPGSGKTNLLILRAKYLTLGGNPNFILLSFTRTLRDFIGNGAFQYGLTDEKVMTCTAWERDILRSLGVPIPEGDNFQTLRPLLAETVSQAIAARGLGPKYHSILLDESQDYLPSELDLFFRLAHHVYAVADAKQKIYSGADAIPLLKSRVNDGLLLPFHYRNGLRICRMADDLIRPIDPDTNLEGTANYDERSRPSTALAHKTSSLAEQCALILDKLLTERKAYPDELLGIVTARRKTLRLLKQTFETSPIAPALSVQSAEEGYAELQPTTRVWLSTIHGAKGLEFRTLHVAAAETINSLSESLQLAYTATTRAKTSLNVYYEGTLPGYIDQAIGAASGATLTEPSVDDLF